MGEGSLLFVAAEVGRETGGGANEGRNAELAGAARADDASEWRKRIEACFLDSTGFRECQSGKTRDTDRYVPGLTAAKIDL